MKSAEGRWFEAIIYELFLKISEETDTIKYLARKGADAPQYQEKIRLGQNGLFYSRSGDITIRGNGQDLAEFDLLLVDSQSHVTFVEVVTSSSDLKEFEQEIQYKKNLLSYLYNQSITPFILISPLDLSNFSVISRLSQDRSNAILHTSSCEEIKDLLKYYRSKIIYNVPYNHSKLITATDLAPLSPFNYKVLHDTVQNKIFTEIKDQKKEFLIGDPQGRVVKKVLYGALSSAAVKMICTNQGMSLRGTRIDDSLLSSYYSKAIIATDLPGYQLILYMRSRQKREYHKFIQIKGGSFKFERTTPLNVGFFLWLESLKPTLGKRATLSLIDAFSRREGLPENERISQDPVKKGISVIPKEVEREGALSLRDLPLDSPSQNVSF